MPVGRNIHFVDAGIEPRPFEPFALQVTASSITQPPVSFFLLFLWFVNSRTKLLIWAVHRILVINENLGLRRISWAKRSFAGPRRFRKKWLQLNCGSEIDLKWVAKKFAECRDFESDGLGSSCSQVIAATWSEVLAVFFLPITRTDSFTSPKNQRCRENSLLFLYEARLSKRNLIKTPDLLLLF